MSQVHRPNLKPQNHKALLGLPLSAMAVLSGCLPQRAMEPAPVPPNFAPIAQPTSAIPLSLDASNIKPIMTELIPIDLPATVRVAAAQNLDISTARERAVAARGRYEASIGQAFPVIAPSVFFLRRDGGFLNTDGRIFDVGLWSFQPSVAIQWVLNPGRVIYDIVAAKKRMNASELESRAVVLETLRRGAVEYYELALRQAAVAASQESVTEAEELVRITALQVETGAGVPADKLRAQASLAQRKQDMIIALQSFYEASVALSQTLHLDASITLVPDASELPPIRLVREDMTIDELIECAVAFRPDLGQVRTLVEAATADRGGAWWQGFGPTVNLSYTYGAIGGRANNVIPGQGIPGTLIVNPFSPTGSFSGNPIANAFIRDGVRRGSRSLDDSSNVSFGFRKSQEISFNAGWRLSLSIFGELKTADAQKKIAMNDATRQVDRVRAQVVLAKKASEANQSLIELAGEQVTAARETLRLSEASLEAGTMTTIDVLQALDSVAQARLRHAEAIVRYNQSQVNLLASLGLLDEPSLLLTHDQHTQQENNDVTNNANDPMQMTAN
ncbi:MAG: TolC family protein [Planctomycetes bacterium]|nr:TolC family protein [Planctomycetota bacterium]